MVRIQICMTSETDWDLFRSFEAIVQRGSLTAAAKALRVSQSTVSRHLAQLEEEAGAPLVLRGPPLRLTERGALLVSAIEPMVHAAVGARAALSSAELRGEVTLSTVGELLRWVLAAEVPSFCRLYPQLRLRLLASNDQSSLAGGDVDVAVRFARPGKGDLVGRKVYAESFGLFAASALTLGPTPPWLGLAGSLAEVPEQRHAERLFRARLPRVVVEDLETLGLLVETGLGVAVLPRRLGRRLRGVVEISPRQAGAEDVGPVPNRDVWIVVHRGKQRIAKVRAVIAWLQASLDQVGQFSSPEIRALLK